MIHWRAGTGLPTLYVETSIVSYLRGRPSGQVVAAARQLLTQQWWAAERSNYELVTSQYVLDEAADGDSALAQRRLEALKDVPIVPVEEAILEIAEEILRKAILPRSASVDALHIAMVAHHATRRRIAEKFGHDLAAIVQDTKKRQATSGHEIWRPKPKPSAASPNS